MGASKVTRISDVMDQDGFSETQLWTYVYSSSIEGTLYRGDLQYVPRKSYSIGAPGAYHEMLLTYKDTCL